MKSETAWLTDEKRKSLESCGAKEVRPGIWVSEKLRICDDKDLNTLHEFKDPKDLYWIFNKEGAALAIGWARRRGKSFIRMNGIYIKIKPMTKSEIRKQAEFWGKVSPKQLQQIIEKPMHCSDEFQSQARLVEFIIDDLTRLKFKTTQKRVKILIRHLQSVGCSLKRASELYRKGLKDDSSKRLTVRSR